MRKGRIAAIILAAGYSSRMGDFKPFLQFGDYSAVETVINMYKSLDINDIILVAGYRGCDVIEKLKNTGVTCILNEDYHKGMFSSIVKGIKALKEKNGAFFIHPVDIPLIKKNTIDIMIDKFLKSDTGVIYPTFFGEMGHPPLIDCKYNQTILNSDGEGGLKRILQKLSHDTDCVPVFDEAILMDMDTEADYKNLLNYYNLGTPNRKECLSILQGYNVSPNVIRHCAEVARVSMKIANIISNSGYGLNIAAIEAAALLHDIAKGQKNHALRGAEILENMGYKNIGYIISTHTDIKVDEGEDITENEVLYLADKLVKEDAIMSLQDRFCQCINEHISNFEALGKIINRYAAAEKIINKVERLSERRFIYG